MTLAERTTTYEYYADTDPDSPWRLKKIIGPSVGAATGPTVQFTYDFFGRVQTTTDSDNYTLTFDYDAMDRLTKTTYPDGTYEETTYNKLDPEGHRDRLGRWSYTFHDELRRIWQTKDPLLRETDFTWCTCGSLDGITDAEDHTTTWPDRDIQGRTRFEERPDGKRWEYVYEDRTSRLKRIIDPQGQVKEFAYALDDKLTSLTYAYELNPTPDVTYNYETGPYGRLQSVLDGTGTTIYGYHPIGAPGALKVASIDGPLPGTTDKIEYGYDAIGLVINRKLNGTANEVTYKFDSLGRLRSQLTPIGTFTFGYVGVTGRRLDLLYPNGQRVDYTYHGALDDHRLQDIHNKRPSGSTLSKFSYTYDDVATINTWSQQRGLAAQTYDFTYDAADQLRFATPIGSSLPSYEFTYDAVGNRKEHIVDADVLEAQYDNRNRILEYGPPGGTPTIFSHDDSGNMTAKGSQGYVWDAEYRLVSVNAFAPVLFQYDGQGRRSSKTAAAVTRQYIYDGARLLEERVAGGSSVRYFDGPGIDEHLAMQDSTGVITYFASDHLGSVTDLTTSAGTITLTRKYDPWGNLLSGSTTSGPAFTGRDWDADTGLYYYRARYYDPKIGRFISEDPLFEVSQAGALDPIVHALNAAVLASQVTRWDAFALGGPDTAEAINRYASVTNNPVNYVDPDGQIKMPPPILFPIKFVRCSYQYFTCTSRIRKECQRICDGSPAGELSCVTGPNGYECCRENYFLCITAIPWIDKRPRRECF